MNGEEKTQMSKALLDQPRQETISSGKHSIPLSSLLSDSNLASFVGPRFWLLCDLVGGEDHRLLNYPSQ